MSLMANNQGYLEELKKRAKRSKVYKKYQLTGLTIAQALNDEKHKSLYIKLAQNGDEEQLLRLAKDVADRKGIRNKGAYFMTLFTAAKKDVKRNRYHHK